MIDDIIDETKTFSQFGKTPGKDKKQGKGTLVNLIGKDNVIKYCNDEINKFKKINTYYFIRNPILSKLLDFSLTRIK